MSQETRTVDRVRPFSDLRQIFASQVSCSHNLHNVLFKISHMHLPSRLASIFCAIILAMTSLTLFLPLILLTNDGGVMESWNSSDGNVPTYSVKVSGYAEAYSCIYRKDRRLGEVVDGSGQSFNHFFMIPRALPPLKDNVVFSQHLTCAGLCLDESYWRIFDGSRLRGTLILAWAMNLYRTLSLLYSLAILLQNFCPETIPSVMSSL
jgi:hypothetical protein